MRLLTLKALGLLAGLAAVMTPAAAQANWCGCNRDYEWRAPVYTVQPLIEEAPNVFLTENLYPRIHPYVTCGYACDRGPYFYAPPYFYPRYYPDYWRYGSRPLVYPGAFYHRFWRGRGAIGHWRGHWGTERHMHHEWRRAERYHGHHQHRMH